MSSESRRTRLCLQATTSIKHHAVAWVERAMDDGLGYGDHMPESGETLEGDGFVISFVTEDNEYIITLLTADDRAQIQIRGDLENPVDILPTCLHYIAKLSEEEAMLLFLHIILP